MLPSSGGGSGGPGDGELPPPPNPTPRSEPPSATRRCPLRGRRMLRGRREEQRCPRRLRGNVSPPAPPQHPERAALGAAPPGYRVPCRRDELSSFVPNQPSHPAFLQPRVHRKERGGMPYTHPSSTSFSFSPLFGKGGQRSDFQRF